MEERFLAIEARLEKVEHWIRVADHKMTAFKQMIFSLREMMR